MKKLLILTSAIALLAGCASHRGGTGYSGGSNTGTGYGDTKEPTQQGAGGAALSGNTGAGAGAGYSDSTTASQQGTTSSLSSGQLSSSDAKFIRDAIQGGQAEIKMGQVLVQKSQNPAVKNFGQRLIDDH